mgnify:CR=1 FL=1
MTRILLTRHGHVEGLKPERFRGRAELALTEQGRRDIAALAARVAPLKPAAIYTSPLQRCVQTGAAVAAASGAPSQAHDGLADIDYGGWQMRTHDDVRSEEPEAYARWKAAPQLTRFPGGESLQDVATRGFDLLRAVLARHPDETVVVVGHDSVNRVLLLGLLEMPLSGYWRLVQDPCTLNDLTVTADGTVRVQALNDTSHLDRA